MGMWGYLHRVPADRLCDLLANPAQIQADLYPTKNVKPYPEQTVEKAWDAIEFILDRLWKADRIPCVSPLTGGETGIEFDYGDCWYKTPREVKQTAKVLNGISKDDFKTGYVPELMANSNVYPDIWDHKEDAEKNFEYVWRWYTGMVEFYRQAATNGEGLLLHVA